MLHIDHRLLLLFNDRLTSKVAYFLITTSLSIGLILEAKSRHLWLDTVLIFLFLRQKSIDKSVVSILQFFIHNSHYPYIIIVDEINLSKLERPWQHPIFICEKEMRYSLILTLLLAIWFLKLRSIKVLLLYLLVSFHPKSII